MSAQRELSQQASGKGTAKPLGQMYASYESSPARMQDPWQRTDGTSHAGSEEVYPLMPGYTTSQLVSYSGYKSAEVLSGVSGQGIDRGQSSATYVMDDVIVDFGTVWNVEMPGKGEGKSANMNARTITTTANTVNTRTFKTTKRAVKRTVKDKNGNPVLDENGTPVEELVDVSVDANGNLIDDSGNVVVVLDVNGNAVGRDGDLLVDQDGHPVRLDSPDMSSSGMSNAGMSNSSMNRTLGMSGMGRMNSTGGSPIAVGSSMASENVVGPMPSQMQSPSHTFTVGHGPRSNVVGDPRSMAVGDPSCTSAQLARQKIMKENTSGNLKGGGAVNDPKGGVEGSHSILDRRTRMNNSSMNSTVGMSGMGRMNNTDGSTIAVGSSMASENVMGPMASQMQSPSHAFTVGHGPRSNVVGDPRSMAVGDSSSTSAQLARQKIMEKNTSENLKGGGSVNNPKGGVEGSHSTLDSRTRMNNSGTNSTIGASGMGGMNSTGGSTIAIGRSMASGNVMGPMSSQMQNPSYTFAAGHGPMSSVVGDPRSMAAADPSSTSAQLARQKIMEENTSGNLKDAGAVNNRTGGVEGGHSILDSRTRNEHRYYSGRSDSSPPAGKPGIIKTGKKDEQGKEDKLEGKQDTSKKDEMDKQKKQQRDKNTPSKGDAIMFDGSKGHPDDDDEKKSDDDDSGEEHLTLSMIYENSSAVHSSTSPDASAGGPSASHDVPSSNTKREMLSSMQDYLKRSGFRSALSSEAIMGKPASDDGEDDNDKGRDGRKKKKRKGGKRLGDSDSSSGSESEALIHDAPLSTKMSHSPLKSMVLDSDDSVGSEGSVVHYPLNSDHDIVESYGKDSAKTTSGHDGPDDGDADFKLSILDDGEFIFNGTESTDGRNRSAQNHSGETVSPADVKALRDAPAKAQAWNCFSCAVLWVLSVLGVCVIVVFVLQVLQNGRIESLEQKVGGGCVGIGSNEFLRSADGRLHEAIGGSSSHAPGQFESGGKDPGHGGDKDAEGGNRGSGTQGGRSGVDNKSFEIPGENGNPRSVGKSHIRSRKNNGNAPSEGAKSGAKPGADTANAKPNAEGDAASGKVAGTNGAAAKAKAKGKTVTQTLNGFGDGTGNSGNVGGNVYGAAGGNENGMFNGGFFNGGKTLVGSTIAGLVGGAIFNAVMSKGASNDISTGDVRNELTQFETQLHSMNALLEVRKNEIQDTQTKHQEEMDAMKAEMKEQKQRFEKIEQQAVAELAAVAELRESFNQEKKKLQDQLDAQTKSQDERAELQPEIDGLKKQMEEQETNFVKLQGQMTDGVSRVESLVKEVQPSVESLELLRQDLEAGVQIQLSGLESKLAEMGSEEAKRRRQLEQQTSLVQQKTQALTEALDSRIRSQEERVSVVADQCQTQLDEALTHAVTEFKQLYKQDTAAIRNDFESWKKDNDSLMQQFDRMKVGFQNSKNASSSIESRLNDLTASTLVKEAETQSAGLWSKLREEFAERESEVAKRLGELEAQLSSVQENIKKQEDILRNMIPSQKERESAAPDEFRKQLDETEAHITELVNRRCQRVTDAIRNEIQTRDALVQQKLVELSESDTNLEAEKGKLEHQISELRKTVTDETEQLGETRQSLNGLERTVRQVKELSGTAATAEQLSTMQGHFEETLTQLKTTVAQGRSGIQGLQDRISKVEKDHNYQGIETDIKAMRAEVEGFKQRVLQSEASFNEEMERAKSQVRSFEEKFKGIDSEVQAMSEARTEFESGLNDRLTQIVNTHLQLMRPRLEATVTKSLQPDLHQAVRDVVNTAIHELRIQRDKFELEVSRERHEASLKENRLLALESAALRNTHK